MRESGAVVSSVSPWTAERKKTLLELVPVMAATSYAAFGIFGLAWKVSDLFFWFWSETVLLMATTFVLAQLWLSAQPRLPVGFRARATFEFLFGFGLGLFFTSLFAAMTYIGEWKSWQHFPAFVADKYFGLATMLFVSLVCFAVTVAQGDYRAQDYNVLCMPLGRKFFSVLFLYLAMIVHYHGSGSKSLDLSPKYLKAMATALLMGKLIAELGAFDLLFRYLRNRKAKDA